MLRKISLILFCAIAFGGCATSSGIADSAISTNLQFEEIQNKSLLLNVVRASLRRPPVYQTLEHVIGSVQPSGGAELTIPFGPGAGANSFGLKLGNHDGPQITVAPLDKQEFYRGIMAPLTMDEVDFYVQEGYAKELLLNLFVGRFDLHYAGMTRKVVNYASSDPELNRFQTLTNGLLSLGLTTEQLKKGKKAVAHFCFDSTAHQNGVGPICGKRKKDGGHFWITACVLNNILGTDNGGFGRIAHCNKAQVNVTVSARSPDGIVYYLGEILRRRLYPDKEPHRTIGYHKDVGAALPCTFSDQGWSSKDCTPIFWVARNEQSASDAASVEYEGATFSVPGAPAMAHEITANERSSQVFGIVLQLIGLHYTAKDSPKSSVVNVAP